MINNDGAVFQGNFLNDYLHGAGTITDTDGTVLEGDFVMGKIKNTNC